jgi:DNA-binding NtrC family response regulator
MKQTSESSPVVADGTQQEPQVSSESAGSTSPCTGGCFTLRTLRNRAEVQAIQQALGRVGWNRRQAAQLLQISYRSLLLKIQQHKITRQTQ